MPPSAATDRVARTLAVMLALVGIVCVTSAGVIQHDVQRRRTAVAHTVPPALTRVTAPVLSAAPNARPSPAGPKPAIVLSPIVPAHLYVPAIGVNTTVAAKATELAPDPFLGKAVPSFGVPDDLYTTTWWSSGPNPGSAGMAVVLGHTQIGGYGVFNQLGRLKAGQVIGLGRGTTTLRFAVLAVHTDISKRNPTALQTVLARHPAAARLALLTCSGDFNPGFRESAENTVVFARLVSVSA